MRGVQEYLLPWNFQEQTEIMTSLLAAAPLFHSVVKKWLQVWTFIALILWANECETKKQKHKKYLKSKFDLLPAWTKTGSQWKDQRQPHQKKI